MFPKTLKPLAELSDQDSALRAARAEDRRRRLNPEHKSRLRTTPHRKQHKHLPFMGKQ